LLQKRVVILSLNVRDVCDVLQEGGTTFSPLFTYSFKGQRGRELFHVGKSPFVFIKWKQPSPSNILPFDGLRWIKLAFWYKRYVISTVQSILSTTRLFCKLLKANATLLKLILRKISHLTNVHLPFLLIINNGLLSREVGIYCSTFFV